MTDNPISKQLILDILNRLRRYIAHYIKVMYIIENISVVNKMERFVFMNLYLLISIIVL